MYIYIYIYIYRINPPKMHLLLVWRVCCVFAQQHQRDRVEKVSALRLCGVSYMR